MVQLDVAVAAADVVILTVAAIVFVTVGIDFTQLSHFLTEKTHKHCTTGLENDSNWLLRFSSM